MRDLGGNVKKTNDYLMAHLLISVLFFVASLMFPAFYLEPALQPQHSGGLLMLGWLGPLNGQFSWFANCFYVLALLKAKKQKKSLCFGVIALGIALSFLGHSTINLGEGPVGDRIVCYGWGYFLWVLSISSLVIVQLLIVKFKEINATEKKRISLIHKCFLGVAFTIFAYYFFVSETGPFFIKKENNKQFEQICNSINNKKTKTSFHIKGLYFESYPFLNAELLPAINISFIERPTRKHDKSNKKYVRILSTGESIFTDEILSNLCVIHYYPKYNKIIRGAIYNTKFEIIDRNTGELIAESGYARNAINNESCGQFKGSGYLFIKDFLEFQHNKQKD